MSGRKATRRPKARKAKRSAKPVEVYLHGYTYTPDKHGFVEIEGHQLNPEQFGMFQKNVKDRWNIATRPSREQPINDPEEYARRTALSDVLYRYRPHAKAKERLLTLGLDVSHAAQALTGMRDYHWLYDEKCLAAACEMVQKLADEVETRLKRVRFFIESVALEGDTKLQDWMRRDEELQKIGGEAPRES